MRRNLLSLSVLLSVVLLLVSCAKKVQNPEAKARAATHQLLAVIPPDVAINGIRQWDSPELREQQRKESLNFQQRMYTWMLRGKAQKQIFVNIQKIQDTNALLEEAGYFSNKSLSPAQLCTVLGVDAILTSNYSVQKTMTYTQANMLGIGKAGIAPAAGEHNNAAVILELYDQETDKIVWNYVHKLSRDTRTVPSRSVDELMLSASKKSPYYQTKSRYPL